MRPVHRGKCGVAFHRYNDARDPLETAIGNYCSYCERHDPSHIEHRLPWKDKHTTLENDWDNLLLACEKCNAYKRSRQDATPYDNAAAAREKYIWPDTDNTAHAFVYDAANRVNVRGDLSGDDLKLAQATHHMLGFDEDKPDRRWRARKSAWTRACELKTNWDITKSPENRQNIVNSAVDNGFFSVWRVVFNDVPEIITELNKVFPGTDISCFDGTSHAPLSYVSGRPVPPPP